MVRGVERRTGTVLATLRVEGRDDRVKEWPLDELVPFAVHRRKQQLRLLAVVRQ